MKDFISIVALLIALTLGIAVLFSFSEVAVRILPPPLAVQPAVHQKIAPMYHEIGNASTKAPQVTSVARHKGRMGKLEEALSKSRASIRRAILSRNYTSRRPQDFIPSGPIYHNPHAFLQSYIEMEKRMKVYAYEDGEPPLFHDGPCTYVYSIEGHFIHELEEHKTFVTTDPEDALVYFLPISIVNVVKNVYGNAKKREWEPLHRVVNDYVTVIANKYPYWNRTRGSDHFMLSCHDWAPYSTIKTPDLFNRSIRVLCNANTSEGFNPKKDVPLPEFFMKTYALPNPVQTSFPKKMLAFFAGGNHGPIRPILLQHWKGKDQQVQVYEYLPKGLNYTELLLSSKYCLCPSGFEVASPRLVEAIYAGCVPVTISQDYVLPFSDVLDWTQFSIQIPVLKIPEIKDILSAIHQSTYLRLQENVFKVQRHFILNRPSKRMDVIGMLFHSIWLRRLNVRLHDL